MTQQNRFNTLLPKPLYGIALILVSFLIIQGCGGSKSITSTQVDTTAKVAKNADPFATLDDHKETIDSAIVEERLEAARQEWLRALAAEQRKDKNEVVRRFEVGGSASS